MRKQMESFKFNKACQNLTPARAKSMRGSYNLWALRIDNRTISCWKVPLRHRIGLLFHGNIWLESLGNNQPAVGLQCRRNILKRVK